MDTQFSDDQLKQAFVGIKRDMENVKATLNLHRDFVDQRMKKAEEALLSAVEKRFFNGTKYLTQDEFDAHLDQVLVQIDPVQELLGRMATVDEGLGHLTEQQRALHEQLDHFITEKDIQFLLRTMDARIRELDSRIPQRDLLEKQQQTMQQRFSAEMDKLKATFSKESVSLAKQIAKIDKKVGLLERRMIDKGRLIRSLR